jgi:hypothetical protein
LIGDVVSRQRDSRAGRVNDDALAKTDLGITVKPFEPMKARSDLGHLVPTGRAFLAPHEDVGARDGQHRRVPGRQPGGGRPGMIRHLEALLIIIGQLAVWTLVQQLKHEVDHQTTPTTASTA